MRLPRLVVRRRAGSAGSCPGLREVRTQSTWHVPSHATIEQDGFVWAWGEPDAEPTRPPFALPVVDGRGAGETVFRADLDSTLRASLENALDVPHTAFLHRGLFRGKTRNTITAVRRPIDGGVEVQYLGEPVGMGPIRLAEGSGRTFDHWDRFLLPSIAQIEYAVEGWFRIVNTLVQLPLSPFRTRAWFVVRFSSPLPAPARAGRRPPAGHGGSWARTPTRWPGRPSGPAASAASATPRPSSTSSAPRSGACCVRPSAPSSRTATTFR